MRIQSLKQERAQAGCERTGIFTTSIICQPGAPLSNNICERALKAAILHRKNSLGYKTQNGARVGDLFMSLIHTCRLAAANPFAYFRALHDHAKAVLKDPGAWLPWNYSQSSEALDSG
jgi:transposase